MTDDDQPIAEIRDLEVPVSDGFRERVRAKIERREATNSFLTLFWNVPLMIFLEFLAMIFEIFSPNESNGGSQ